MKRFRALPGRKTDTGPQLVRRGATVPHPYDSPRPLAAVGREHVRDLGAPAHGKWIGCVGENKDVSSVLRAYNTTLCYERVTLFNH
jgi:hypothetical protein